MKTDDAVFIRVEKDYWDLLHKLDLFEYITPANIAEEKAAFLSAISHGKVYNPIFAYPPLQFDVVHTLHILEDFLKHFRMLSHPLVRCYEELINDDIEFIRHISDRSSPRFPEWLAQVYGYPGNSDHDRALEMLETSDHSEPADQEPKVTDKVLRERIETKLKELEIHGWDIEVKNSTARLSVNPVITKITIQQGAFFDVKEIDRLFVHEIGTHVLRYENGKRQASLLFSRGFPDYLETEEGLAIFSEERQGLLSKIALAKYCCRVIAAYLCQNSTFYEIFQRVCRFLNESDSFDVAMRTKRGMLKTDRGGGFTKDQIYLSGLLKIKSLEPDVRKCLFVGKLGIQHLPLLEKVNINYDIQYPPWID